MSDNRASRPDAPSIERFVLEKLHDLQHLKDLDVDVLAAILVGVLCADPSESTVWTTKGLNSNVVEFKVPNTDRWRILGKKGHTIKSIWSLCKSYAKSRRQDVLINVVGEEDEENEDALG